MTVLTLQVPKRARLEHFYRVTADNATDGSIREALDKLLADRAAHEIKRKPQTLEKR